MAIYSDADAQAVSIYYVCSLPGCTRRDLVLRVHVQFLWCIRFVGEGAQEDYALAIVVHLY